MSKHEYLSRFNLIIKKLQKAPASFNEISDYLIRESEYHEYDFRISKRTFQRDLLDIKEALKVVIEFDKSKKVYFIADDFEENEPMKNRMLEAFELFNAFNITENLNEFVLFEKRKSKGMEHFYGLLHAIKNRFVIELTHQKFTDDEPTNRKLFPLALKEFKGRWYLLAKEETSETLKTFGLDRIIEFTISKKQFPKYNSTELNKLYADCFGIINPANLQPEKVVLVFNYEQGQFIKTYPLHPSQKVISEKPLEDAITIELTLKITFDFVMELLSFGEDLIVQKPLKLKKQLKSIIENTLKNYE